jgi:hypothetical protein
VSDVLKLGEKVARLSKKTQNKHLDFLIGFFNWQALADYRSDNPFTGTLHKKREMRRDGTVTRTSLTDEEQMRLFASPVWRGSVSAYNRTAPRPVPEGGVIVRDALFWIPLLAAFQGFRLHEALQLFIEDIVPEHGTHWFRVRRGRGRHVKTDAGSARCRCTRKSAGSASLTTLSSSAAPAISGSSPITRPPRMRMPKEAGSRRTSATIVVRSGAARSGKTFMPSAIPSIPC